MHVFIFVDFNSRSAYYPSQQCASVIIIEQSYAIRVDDRNCAGECMAAIFRYLLAWTGLAVIAVLNGTLRVTVFLPYMNDLSAHQVSTLTGAPYVCYKIRVKSMRRSSWHDIKGATS
jgi:hypothetical protein